MIEEDIRNKELFLLDLDGTLYIENHLIKGSVEFIDLLKKQNKKYILLTNNSSKSLEKHVEKINKLGLKINNENMFTSSLATCMYLKNKKENAKIYVVGTESLRKEFENQGFYVCENVEDNIDFLIVGFDVELNYKKLEDACYLLDNGVEYIATNPDLVCPIENGRYIPDCGSICNMLKTATNREPKFIGKPRREMIDIVSKMENIPLEKIAIIGDRLYTDIACGLNAGITTICVLSGESSKEDIDRSIYKPTYIVDSINDIYKILK